MNSCLNVWWHPPRWVFFMSPTPSRDIYSNGRQQKMMGYHLSWSALVQRNKLPHQHSGKLHQRCDKNQDWTHKLVAKIAGTFPLQKLKMKTTDKNTGILLKCFVWSTVLGFEGCSAVQTTSTNIAVNLWVGVVKINILINCSWDAGEWYKSLHH